MSTARDRRRAERERLHEVMLKAPMLRGIEGKAKQIACAEYALDSLLRKAIDGPVTFEVIKAEVERYNASVAKPVAAEDVRP